MAGIDPEELEKHRPQITYEVGLFFVDYLRRLNREFDSDITMAIVLGEIAQHSVRDLMKRDFPKSGLSSAEFATFDRVSASLKRCNSMSVAESSGIPRETVRRKVEKLLARSLITRDESGGLALVPDIIERFRSFDHDTTTNLVALADRIRGLVGSR